MKENNYELNMSAEQEETFQKATHCWMCEKELNGDSVRDHDHFIKENNFRGAAHSNCNLNCKRPKTIPVVFHNMSGYDIHLFIKALAQSKRK